MKIEQFNIATKNIINKIIQASKTQTPFLDYIMQVEKMSPEDKLFYEAYKKYGNRNHTWQDFKAMFNGDIANMQATIKHWKTWDEINAAFHAENKIRAILIKHNLNPTNTQEYEILKTQYPDLAQADKEWQAAPEISATNYSTFDPKIEKLCRKYEQELAEISPQDNNAIMELNKKYTKEMAELTDLRNRDFVTGERLETYWNIISANKNLLNMAQNFESLSKNEIDKFAKLIINASAQRFGTSGDFAPSQDGKNAYDYSTKQIKITTNTLLKNTPLLDFLILLSHEDAHRIDDQNPYYGMLGPRIMQLQKKIYLSEKDNKELYEAQPTEQSSHYLDIPVAAGLFKSLKQNN